MAFPMLFGLSWRCIYLGIGNQKRYSTDELEEMDVIYTPLDTGTKKDMHSKQTEMIRKYKEQNNGKRPKYNKSDY